MERRKRGVLFFILYLVLSLGSSPLSTTGVDIVTNACVYDPATHKVSRHSALLARGQECFDAEAYRRVNPELRTALPQNDRDATWSHALQHGQFELRLMAFRCSAFGVPRRDYD